MLKQKVDNASLAMSTNANAKSLEWAKSKGSKEIG